MSTPITITQRAAAAEDGITDGAGNWGAATEPANISLFLGFDVDALIYGVRFTNLLRSTVMSADLALTADSSVIAPTNVHTITAWVERNRTPAILATGRVPGVDILASDVVQLGTLTVSGNIDVGTVYTIPLHRDADSTLSTARQELGEGAIVELAYWWSGEEVSNPNAAFLQQTGTVDTEVVIFITHTATLGGVFPVRTGDNATETDRPLLTATVRPFHTGIRGAQGIGVSRADECPICGHQSLRETWVRSGHFRFMVCPGCSDPFNEKVVRPRPEQPATIGED